jgi:hypothetical protein
VRSWAASGHTEMFSLRADRNHHWLGVSSAVNLVVRTTNRWHRIGTQPARLSLTGWSKSVLGWHSSPRDDAH